MRATHPRQARRDGVGPRDARPSIVNSNRGGVTEDNGVGTHEYLALVEALGSEPFAAGRLEAALPLRSGVVLELR